MYNVMMCSLSKKKQGAFFASLALPLGELSPKVTERACKPFIKKSPAFFDKGLI